MALGVIADDLKASIGQELLGDEPSTALALIASALLASRRWGRASPWGRVQVARTRRAGLFGELRPKSSPRQLQTKA